jgi:AraC-like DNA-binding protein
MSSHATEAHAERRTITYAANPYRSPSIELASSAFATQRTHSVSEVLAQLGKLVLEHKEQVGGGTSCGLWGIDIDHASAMTMAPPGAPIEHKAMVVRMSITVTMPSLKEDASRGSMRDGDRAATTATALLEALKALATSGGAQPEPEHGIFDRMPPGSLSTMTLLRVKAHIERHLADRIQLADLAAFAQLSVGRFVRAFRCSTGIPPYRYLIQRRVAAAAVLIRETDQSLTDIAQETGFSDQSHLCRSFAQVLRITPGSYRRTFR